MRAIVILCGMLEPEKYVHNYVFFFFSLGVVRLDALTILPP